LLLWYDMGQWRDGHQDKAEVDAMKGKKTISYVPGLFDEFKVEDNYDRWDRLPDLLWGLGFEMDAYNSFREYEKQSTLKLKPASSKREERKNILYLLEHADRQIVGNYLFSTWRDYTHWCIPYDDAYATDFLRRIIVILESKYEEVPD